MKLINLILIFILFQIELNAQVSKTDLEKIRLPENYRIEIFVDGIENPRALDFASDGTLFVGSRRVGKVYAVKDGNVIVIDSGLQMPTGLDFHEGDLYVGAVSTIFKYPDILNNLKNPKREVVMNSFPSEAWHGWKFIKFGPDGKLYVPVGAACNVCDSTNPIFATINRINKNGTRQQVYARGVRNTVGFDFHPVTGELWFTDNGRDLMGDDLPPDELNRVEEQGQHFGFPYLHATNIEDPEFWASRPKKLEFINPEWEIQAHSAALGMRFYTGEMFESKYKNGIFITEHGSWNRTKKVGYAVSFVTIKDNKAFSYEVFASGWLQGEDAWGRPADVTVGPDGALYVSDDYADCIYRIYYHE